MNYLATFLHQSRKISLHLLAQNFLLEKVFKKQSMKQMQHLAKK